MIRLYTAGTPNGRKASIALEELTLDYEVTRIDTAAGEQKKPAFLALNPNHKIPVLEDDGQVIWESGAILLHLGEKHDPQERILPKDPQLRMQAIQYAFFQTGGIGPNTGRLGEAIRREPRIDEMVAIFAGEVDRLLGVIDRILSDGRDFLVGPYTIGDIMHYPWLHPVWGLKAPPLMNRPRVVAWLERIAKRPAVEKGMGIPE